MRREDGQGREVGERVTMTEVTIKKGLCNTVHEPAVWNAQLVHDILECYHCHCAASYCM